jgi:hypothetical protein
MNVIEIVHTENGMYVPYQSEFHGQEAYAMGIKPPNYPVPAIRDHEYVFNVGDSIGKRAERSQGKWTTAEWNTRVKYEWIKLFRVW